MLITVRQLSGVAQVQLVSCELWPRRNVMLALPLQSQAQLVSATKLD